MRATLFDVTFVEHEGEWGLGNYARWRDVVNGMQYARVAAAEWLATRLLTRALRPSEKEWLVRQPLHNVLERHTWHPAQQVRQLMLLRRDNGIEPDGPLSEADFAGLPLPTKVWDDEAGG